ELEVIRLKQHVRAIAIHPQADVGDVLVKLALEVIPGPTLTTDGVLVLKVLTQVLGELGIAERVPADLRTGELEFRHVVRVEAHTHTSRERQSTQIDVLTRRARGQ